MLLIGDHAERVVEIIATKWMDGGSRERIRPKQIIAALFRCSQSLQHPIRLPSRSLPGPARELPHVLALSRQIGLTVPFGDVCSTTRPNRWLRVQQGIRELLSERGIATLGNKFIESTYSNGTLPTRETPWKTMTPRRAPARCGSTNVLVSSFC
jgi:hypothetical protein